VTPSPDPVSLAPVHWRVSSYGRDQTLSARAHYWYDNFARQPEGLAVFQYVQTGVLTYIENGREHQAGPGQAVLFAYGENSNYGLRPSPGSGGRPIYKTTFINLAGAGITQHWNALRARHTSIIRPDKQIIGSMDRLIDSAAPGSGVSPAQQTRAVHEFMLDLADHLEGQAAGRAAPVGQAVRWILSRPTEDWSLKELADRFGCSREHLIRVFSNEQGQTPGQFVAQARQRKALALLLETDLPLKDVAAQSGYHSAHTLARQVVKATGLSPENYRASRRSR
jgi:AraC-like DNA-binding protein